MLKVSITSIETRLPKRIASANRKLKKLAGTLDIPKQADSLDRMRIFHFRNNVLAVIIDNTNIRMDECKTYFQKAASHGYIVLIVEPRTSWKRDVDILSGRFDLTNVRLTAMDCCRM